MRGVIYQFGLGASVYLVWLDGRMRFNFGGRPGPGVTGELIFFLAVMYDLGAQLLYCVVAVHLARVFYIGRRLVAGHRQVLGRLYATLARCAAPWAARQLVEMVERTQRLVIAT